MQQSEPFTERGHDPPVDCMGHLHTLNPSTGRCYCGARKYKQIRVYSGQGNRSRIRRLRQVASGQLSGGVTPEARETAQRIAFGIAVEQAKAAVFAFLCASESDGRERLYDAVRELARWVRGELDDDNEATASTSARIDDAPAAAVAADDVPSGDSHHDLVAL